MLPENMTLEKRGPCIQTKRRDSFSLSVQGQPMGGQLCPFLTLSQINLPETVRCKREITHAVLESWTPCTSMGARLCRTQWHWFFLYVIWLQHPA